MDMAALKAELADGKYVGKTAAEKLDALLAKSIVVPKTGTRVAELGILDVLGPEAGEAFLQGIEAAATQNPVLARVVRWLRTEYGVDVGNPVLQAQLRSLAAANVVSNESAELLIAHGSKLISVAEQNGWTGLGLGHIESAEAA